MASVTASPMNAMPRDCMANLGLMGIRPRVQPLDTTSLVSRCRVAMTCSSLQKARAVLDEALMSPDILFVPPKEWLNNSISNHLQEACDTVHNKFHNTIHKPSFVYKAESRGLQ